MRVAQLEEEIAHSHEDVLKQRIQYVTRVPSFSGFILHLVLFLSLFWWIPVDFGDLAYYSVAYS